MNYNDKRVYKLFNYKYVHIVKSNVLHLNRDFFFLWVWPDGPDRPLGNLQNIFHQLANQF